MKHARALPRLLLASILSSLLGLLAPAAQAQLFPPGGGGGSCDPSRASCLPPGGGGGGLCTLFPNRPECQPGGGGGGGGTCTPPPGGNPSCGGGGPAGLAGGGAAGVQLGGGNPINLVNGNKYQEETDLAALPGVLGLELKRHYNSQSSHAGIVGPQWRLSYETVLYDLGSQIQILQADGRRITLAKGPGGTLCTSPQLSDGQVRIERRADGQPVYHWRWPDGRTLSFHGGSGGGHPLHTVRAASGEQLQLNYNPLGDLIGVQDPQGRKLSLIYGRAGAGQRALLQAVDTPTGRIAYQHDKQGRLLQASFSAKSTGGLATTPEFTRIYHHEAQHNGGQAHSFALTGISLQTLDPKTGQARTQRLSTYAYDREGRAVLSSKGQPLQLDGKGQPVPDTGIEQISLQFIQKPLPTEGKPDREGIVQPQNFGKTQLTNSLGQQSTLLSAIVGGQFRLIELRGPGCSSCGPANMRYGYDSSGRLLRSTQLDAQGQPVQAELRRYDAWGRLLQLSQQAYQQGKPAGAPQLLKRYEYTDRRFKDGSIALGQQPTLIARPSVMTGKEHSTRLSYNDLGQVVRVSEAGWSPVSDKGDEAPQGVAITRTTEYRYSTINGRSVLAAIDGPLPNGPKGTSEDSDVTQVLWDARADRPVKMIHPMGLTTRAEYSAEGLTQKLIGMDGVISEFEYSPGGAIASITRAGVKRRFEHDSQGQTVGVLEATGARTRAAFDLSGQLTALFDGQNNRIELTRDLEGRLTRARLLDSKGSVSQQRDFAAQDELAAASGSGRDSAMEAMRQIVSRAEDSGNMARPDLLAAMHAAQDALSDTAAPRPQAYAQVADANGAFTGYYRDDFHQLRRVESPTTGVAVFEYDAAGRLLARVNVDLHRAEYRRDPAGRVVAVKVSDVHGNVDEDAQIIWGPGNKPQRIRYLAGEEHFAYDSGGRLVEHEQRVDQHRWKIRYAYNAAGQMTGKTLPGGQMLSYRYRGSQHPRAGLLESAWLGTRLERPLVYGLNDETDSYTQRRFMLGNGLSNERSLDAQGRVVAAGTAEVGQTQLGYASATPGDDEPAQVRTQRSLGLGQVAAGSPLWQARLHAQMDRWRSPVSAAQLPADGSAHEGVVLPSELFDDLGRQLTRGGLRFSYDALNRLTEVQRDTSTAMQPVAQYRYNLFGQRIAKVVPQAGGQGSTTTYFFYDGSQLVAEADAEGAVQQQYVWINDKPVAMLAQGQVLHVHTDHRNAPLALTDASRQVVWQAQVADYLAATPAQGRSLGSVAFNLRGSKQYHDPETGLHYNTHRYYDAQAGRYLTPDPMGLAVGPDLYAFALNRPHSMQDPLGLQPAPGRDWSNASFVDKLGEVFQLALTKFPGQLGADLQQALQEAVNDLPTTAAIFVAWQIISATPIGWIVNGLMVAYAAYSLGSEAITLAKALGRWVVQVSDAKTAGQLCTAASSLAALMSSLASNTAFNRINPGKALRAMRNAAGGKSIAKSAAPDPGGSRKAKVRLEKLTPRHCFNPYGSAYDNARDKPAFEREFKSQLARQQDAINKMSADEFLAARKAYDANKRNPAANQSQAEFRAKYKQELEIAIRDELQSQGFAGAILNRMTQDKVNSTMDNLAALHEPDMVAGGFFNHTPSCMGNRSVNCSIGAQWGNKLTEMENYAKQAVQAGHGGARMSLEFSLCRRP